MPNIYGIYLSTSSDRKDNVKSNNLTTSTIFNSSFHFHPNGLEPKNDSMYANTYFYNLHGSPLKTIEVPLTRIDEQGEALSNSGIFIADKDLAILRGIIKRVDSRSTQRELLTDQATDIYSNPIKMNNTALPTNCPTDTTPPSVSSGVIGIVMVAVFGSLLIIGVLSHHTLVSPAVAGVVIIFGISFVAMHFSSNDHVKS